jgi:hypothetical protein
MKTNLLAVLMMVCGCGYDMDTNWNDGSKGLLGFEGAYGSHALVGSFTVTVSHQPSGRFHCSPSVQFGDLGGGNGCQPVDSASPVAALMSATCSSDLCTASIEPSTKEGEVPVRIVAHSTGTVELQVWAKLADGTVRNDSVALEFHDLASVTCDDPAGCITPDAIPEGATTTWRIQCLASDCTHSGIMDVVPSDVLVVSDVTNSYDPKTHSSSFTLRAEHAGVAELALLAGTGNWVYLQVRVVGAGQSVAKVAQGDAVPSFIP